jgi:hypothetical protein
VQGGAVTVFLPFADEGRPRFCAPPLDDPPELPPLEPPELPPLEPPLELEAIVHGGTITVVTPLLLGSTSWFCGCEPPELPPLEPPDEPPEDDELAWAFTSPGVSRIVLEGGGWLELDEEPPLDPPLEPPLDPPLEDDELCCMHGCTATVCVSVPCGTMIWFDPGGIFELPDCATVASEHGGTAMVRSPCCLGITTVRTPGVWSAIVTGSICELDDLLPHALTPSAIATAPTPTDARQATPVMLDSPP